MTEENRPDILIVGAGLAGLVQYSLLAKAGFDVALADPQSFKALNSRSQDSRATALTPKSIELLGLETAWLEANGALITAMIVDGGREESLNEEEALSFQGGSWIVMNHALKSHLASQVKDWGLFSQTLKSSAVENGRRQLAFKSGMEASAPLVVAADGKFSALRVQENILKHEVDFGQTALTGVIAHSQAHDGRAFQRFLPGGTLALLPLPGTGHESSFIWVEKTQKAKDFFALDPALLAALMHERLGPVLGDLRVPIGQAWGAFELKAHHCDKVVGERLALIGEAAHALHPLAGQGLNLSIKDAAALRDALVDQRRLGMDLGDDVPLLAYQSARRADVARLMTLTNGLHSLFDRTPGPLRALATAGLEGLSKIKPLRSFLERQANR